MELTRENTYILIAIGGALLFSVFALALVFFVVSFQKKKLRIDLERTEFEKQINLAVSDAKDEIRRNTLKQVSQELHDNVSHILGVALLHLSSKHNEQNITEVVRPIIKEALHEVRAISHDLQGDVLQFAKLDDAFREHLMQLHRLSGLNWHVNSNHDLEQLSISTRIVIFRIFQELLNNTIKHSHATEVMILLNKFGDFVHFNFQDNGVGFSVTNGIEGIGLTNIKDRINLLRGELHIESEPHKGTQINIRIPYE